MRTPLRLGLAGLSTAALIGATALPAAAGDTTTTFTLSGSTLSIDVQSSANLGTSPSGVTSMSGQLGNVKVTDLRGGTANWNLEGSSTKFTTGQLPNANPTSTSVTYSTGAITTTGSIVIAPSGDQALNATPRKIAGPTTVVGNNTATWNPTLTVGLPSDALAGDYTGTVTTSVS